MAKTVFILVAVLLSLSHISCLPKLSDTTRSTTTAPKPTEEVATTTATTTTAATTTPTPTTAPPTSAPIKTNNIQFDCSNPSLGCLPVATDAEDEMKVINRRYVPLRNCKELLENGFKKSGLYVVQPGRGEFVVYCDMELLGGGWTILQRRTNGALVFEQDFASYQGGFGDFAGEFWLGLDKINRLTNLSNRKEAVELYIGLESFFGRSAFARYNTFSVGSEEEGYNLQVEGYDRRSSAGNSFFSHNGQKFSTYDKDQDSHSSINCAEMFKGGWWYKNCHDSNLNGLYYDSNNNIISVPNGIIWQSWLGDSYSLKSTVLAIR